MPQERVLAMYGWNNETGERKVYETDMYLSAQMPLRIPLGENFPTDYALKVYEYIKNGMRIGLTSAGVQILPQLEQAVQHFNSLQESGTTPEKLGGGFEGTVYDLGENMVIKIIRDDLGETPARHVQVMTAMRLATEHLEHIHFPQQYEYGYTPVQRHFTRSENGFIVMEKAPGITVREYLKGKTQKKNGQ